ncbi:hypothetical protein DPMN_054039 [Dreissena polymorpha]|uniref:Uncharacterized protein n=1 Tax=Dreissena polymorpha TaxID=45954 RepID=A0A9D4CP70_DREPO|nr:hypothetical protein DPMN_054039 [Dreissena polymorpha]
MDLFAKALAVFGLTVSLKEPNISGQDTNNLPCIKIGDYTLQVIDDLGLPSAESCPSMLSFVSASERLRLTCSDCQRGSGKISVLQ